ncbi:hypothetical protein T440DRAFT_555735 [Plenodomus tracheiphilus IPT5]|uniref:F-box domain-containing protein n=1 Tax=Plenodomus tracheiphilus IPT5 TaxID=1408161 RepID=A0A6A7B3K9_9PLEO|nr:hypothetical protein T440DRAFT_555735 [Plenodomus tracheiphilus IPT5]
MSSMASSTPTLTQLSDHGSFLSVPADPSLNPVPENDSTSPALGRCELLELPREILMMIAIELDDIVSLAESPLRRTCKYMNEVVEYAWAVKPSPRTVERLFEYERNYLSRHSPKGRRWACKHCLRLRPRHIFAHDQLLRPDYQNRTCVECGFKKGEWGYGVGESVAVGNERWVNCMDCGQIKKGDKAGPFYFGGRCKFCHDAEMDIGWNRGGFSIGTGDAVTDSDSTSQSDDDRGTVSQPMVGVGHFGEIYNPFHFWGSMEG